MSVGPVKTIAESSGAKVTAFGLYKLFGLGLAYLVPKPEDDHGYTVTYGEVLCATARYAPVEPNATLLPFAGGRVAGLVNLDPKPTEENSYTETLGEFAWPTAMYDVGGTGADFDPSSF
jgi:hypothetical protein